MKKKIIYIIITWFLFFLMFFLVDVLFYLNKFLSYFMQSLFVLPWITAVILTVIYFLKKIPNINIGKFMESSILTGFFIVILFKLLGIILNTSLGLNTVIPKKYVGTYGITYSYDPYNDKEVSIDHKTKIFKIDDNRVSVELKKLEDKYGLSSKKKYFFWQTAYVNGFDPKLISEFKGTDSFNKILTLFFTVGPLFLLEIFIDTILYGWPLFLLPIIGLIFNRKIFEKEVSAIIAYFTQKYHL